MKDFFLTKEVLMCPHCKEAINFIKRGVYRRPSDQKKIQRYQCKNCAKSFSDQCHSFDFRLRKRRINQSVFRLLSKGNSQRGCAQILGVHPKTIARRVTRFGSCAKKHLRSFQKKTRNICEVVFDEMESFEHTKLKPLTIPLAVENKTRKILALDVGKIAAKGHLAEISKRKYGKRMCQRKKVLESLFHQFTPMVDPFCLLKSDESQHYPNVVKKHLKEATHKTYKGRKAAVTGQGELKKGKHDPLFYFNHTAGMIRDNIKRLARRTWCTTKKIERLLDLLHIYAFYHNQILGGKKRVSIFNCSITN